MPVSDYTPTLADVGSLLRSRTKDSAGNETGTFSADTRPTDTEVTNLINNAVKTLATRAGDDIPADLWDDAKNLAAMRAAMLIELSYFPEMVASQRSPYPQYAALWTEGFGDAKTVGTLIQAIENIGSDPTTPTDAAGTANYSFPDPSWIGLRRL